jgi:hypothetical protein
MELVSKYDLRLKIVDYLVFMRLAVNNLILTVLFRKNLPYICLLISLGSICFSFKPAD